MNHLPTYNRASCTNNPGWPQQADVFVEAKRTLFDGTAVAVVGSREAAGTLVDYSECNNSRAVLPESSGGGGGGAKAMPQHSNTDTNGRGDNNNHTGGLQQ